MHCCEAIGLCRTLPMQPARHAIQSLPQVAMPTPNWRGSERAPMM